MEKRSYQYNKFYEDKSLSQFTYLYGGSSVHNVKKKIGVLQRYLAQVVRPGHPNSYKQFTIFRLVSIATLTTYQPPV